MAKGQKKLLLVCGVLDGVSRFRLLNLAHTARNMKYDVYLKTRDMDFRKYDCDVLDYDFYLKEHRFRSRWSIFCGKLFRSLINIAFHIDYQYNYWRKESSSVIDFINKNKIERVFISGPPFSPFTLVSKISKETSAEVILDLRDGFYLHPYVKTSFLDAKLERSCFELAKAIIVTAPSTFNLYTKRYPDLKNKFYRVNNGFDEKYLKCAFKEKVITDKIEIVFAGTIYDFDVFEKFVSALSSAKNKDAYRVTVIGSNNVDKTEEILSKYGLDYRNLPRMPYSRVIEIYKTSAMFLLFLKSPKYVKSYQILAKVYEVLYLNKPILYLGPLKDSYELVRDYSNDFFALDTDAKDCDYDVLTNYLDDFASKSRFNDKFVISSKLNRDYLKEYNRQSLSKKIISIIEE